jgi:Zn-dependent protease
MADEPAFASPVVARSCPACGSEIAPSLLTCPSCHRLVHAERLKALAAAAEAAERAGALPAALDSWREAIALLPPETRQFAIISERITSLGHRVAAGPQPHTTIPRSKADPGGPHATGRWSGGALSGIAATLALAVWKFKFLAVMILTKGKLLLLGLTKASTFWTMFLSFGVYWTVFGGWLALGLVLSIYVHEMGHVFALARYGIRATAPMFVPGLGAVIRLKQGLFDPRQDARVGLAGPIWGLGAALFCGAVYGVTHIPIWAALAKLGGLINLFNLIPVWQLDGGRAFRTLTRAQRGLAVGAMIAAWVVTEEPLLFLLIALGGYQAAFGKPSNRRDDTLLTQYALLVVVLASLSSMVVPMPR